MLFRLYVFILLACFSGWSAATPLKINLPELPELPEITPITELPPGLPTCVGRKTDIDECLKNALNEIKPRLKEGIPELSIPQLDPMVIELDNIQFVNNFGKGHLDIHPLNIHGISESIVQNVNFSIVGDHVKLQLLTESPSIQEEFEGELALDDMYLKSHAKFSSNLTDLVLNIQLEGELSERDGHKYLNLTEIDVDADIGDLTFKPRKIVPNAILNTIIMNFINDHWRSNYKVLLKETRETWVPVALDTANAYLNAIPFDLFFDTS